MGEYGPAVGVQRRTARARLARLATELLAPAVLLAVLLVVLGWHSERYQPRGLLLGAVAALFESVLPFAYIVRGVRAGRFTDHHVGDRRQRRRPLLVALGSVLVGMALLTALSAGRELIAGVASGAVGLIVAVVVSHWWKMSIHAAVAAGACAIFVLIFGPPALVALPLVALVGWSRVELTDHTVAQVVVGTVVGALVAGPVFALLR